MTFSKSSELFLKSLKLKRSLKKLLKELLKFHKSYPVEKVVEKVIEVPRVQEIERVVHVPVEIVKSC
jgi:hypothetical protein